MSQEDSRLVEIIKKIPQEELKGQLETRIDKKRKIYWKNKKRYEVVYEVDKNYVAYLEVTVDTGKRTVRLNDYEIAEKNLKGNIQFVKDIKIWIKGLVNGLKLLQEKYTKKFIGNYKVISSNIFYQKHEDQLEKIGFIDKEKRKDLSTFDGKPLFLNALYAMSKLYLKNNK